MKANTVRGQREEHGFENNPLLEKVRGIASRAQRAVVAVSAKIES